jgi:methionyl-tRNA formyltransferase
MSESSLVFMGSKQAGFDICRTLVEKLTKGVLRAIICPDDSADQRSEMAQFIRLAESSAIPFHVVNNVTETKEIIKKINPAVALVNGWYQILPVAELANTLFLGFHYSPLPKYRGNAPLVWQIINGEKQLGVSFFQLTKGMDEGGLVSQKFFSLSRDESINDALEKAGNLAHQMLLDFLKVWPSGKIHLTNQPNEEPSYCGLRQPGDGKIDWNSDADKLHDFIRAQSKPYPGAYSYLPDGRKLTILKTGEENRQFYGVPGSVVELNSDDVLVACATGAIRLQKISIEDGAEESPRNVLKSLKIRLS